MRPLCSFIVLLLLAGCASGQDGLGRRSAYPSVRATAWDGFGTDPGRPPRISTKVAVDAARLDLATRQLQREQVLETLRPYSDAWWAVHDEIEADRELRLTKRLVICVGCAATVPPSGERTGSVR